MKQYGETPQNPREVKGQSPLQWALDRVRRVRGRMAAPDSVSTTHRVTVARSDHTVTRKLINKNALKVLYRLNEAEFEAFLVGGGVRDILTGLKPKDFDVATNATPEQVKSLFRNSRIIGRRFRLVHVIFGREVIEVATFRASHDSGDGGETGESGRILRDNVFGTIEEDALRRDFTVNALYYNIADYSVIDFVGGLNDIESKTFRLIGDPVVRCEEDPVRVIRAARLAAKLDFDIAEETRNAMQACAHRLSDVPPARLFEELLKLFQGGYALQSFANLRRFELLQYLFPRLATALENDDQAVLGLVTDGLSNTDTRVLADKPVTPAYLLAFMLWHDVYIRAKALYAGGKPAVEAMMRAADEVLPAQLRVTSIPKRFSGPMREIWTFQPRLEQYTGGRALALMENRRFRAAYDFLCLRAGHDPALQECADWWTRVQELPEDQRAEFVREKRPVDRDWSGQSRSGRSRRPRRRRAKK